MKRFIIYGAWSKKNNDVLFWSNDLVGGWVDRFSAYPFKEKELEYINFPIEAEGIVWIANEDIRVSVDYRICGIIDIPAIDIDDACSLAMEFGTTTNVYDREYIDDSWNVNKEMTEELN